MFLIVRFTLKPAFLLSFSLRPAFSSTIDLKCKEATVSSKTFIVDGLTVRIEYVARILYGKQPN